MPKQKLDIPIELGEHMIGELDIKHPFHTLFRLHMSGSINDWTQDNIINPACAYILRAWADSLDGGKSNA